VPGCSFNDFDALLLRRFLTPGQGDTLAQLSRLHLPRDIDGVAVPTVLGALLCTLEPSRWLHPIPSWAETQTSRNTPKTAPIVGQSAAGRRLTAATRRPRYAATCRRGSWRQGR